MNQLRLCINNQTHENDCARWAVELPAQFEMVPYLTPALCRNWDGISLRCNKPSQIWQRHCESSDTD